MLLFFASLLIVVVIIQDNGGQVFSGKFLYLLFLGNQGHFDASRVIGIYLTYVFIFGFLVEVFNSVFRKKIQISLKQKLKFVLGFFLVAYSAIAIWFLIAIGFSEFMVIVAFLFFSLISGAIGISLSHVIGLFRSAINNL